MSAPRRLVLAVALAALVLAAAVPAQAARAPQLTPLVASTMAPPVPVKGTDGRWHLAYEVRVENPFGAAAVLEDVAVLAGGSGRVVGRFDGAQAVAGLLATVQFAPLDPTATTIPPHVTTILWINLDFARRALVPDRLVHRLRVQAPGPTGPEEQVVMDVARTRVSRRRAVVLGPPLRGAGYVDINGCCGVAPHTRAIQTIDGRQWLSQRFAIDWIRVDAQGNAHAGDPSDPASYFVYDQPVLAVARGRVASVLDGRPDQHPPMPDRTLTRQNAAEYVTGNHVIIDIGHGNYAVYAHLRPGLITVREGQRVRRGQVIGRVGNSGNSTEPHLHFHISSRPYPLEADGLPYVYDRFRVTARVGNAQAFVDTPDGLAGVAVLVPVSGSTRHRDELPLMDDIVDFGR